MKFWVDALTMEIPTIPEGDILTAIDNNEVLMKKWKVQKGQLCPNKYSYKCLLC